MKKILTNYRYYVMFVLLIIAVLGVFSVPVDDLPFGSWLYVLISSKVIGLGAGWILYKLVTRWERLGTIPEFTEMADEF